MDVMSQDQNPYSSSYIHGTAAEEQRRLAKLNDLINEASLKELALRSGKNVLDVGSGLGQFARLLARTAGRGARTLAIERDEQQLTEALRLARDEGEEGLVDFRRGDAMALPLRDDEWGTFDVAHARFVLEHVTHPLAVVTNMVRAVKPGGRVVLEDDDHDVLRLWPEPPGVRQVWEAYVRTYDRLGNDQFIGRRLVSLLHEAGAVPQRNTWIFFGGCQGHPAFTALALNMIKILEGARDTVLAQSFLNAEYFDAGIQALQAWRQRPEAALWYAISWAEGVRPPT
ncbi:MAG TPA: methyltransferase domain-containing protein [Gemmataceae bacterium]|nr:methyltransferase domain-containing protein [Gemmataceae bacterium]